MSHLTPKSTSASVHFFKPCLGKENHERRSKSSPHRRRGPLTGARAHHVDGRRGARRDARVVGVFRGRARGDVAATGVGRVRLVAQIRFRPRCCLSHYLHRISRSHPSDPTPPTTPPHPQRSARRRVDARAPGARGRAAAPRGDPRGRRGDAFARKRETGWRRERRASSRGGCVARLATRRRGRAPSPGLARARVGIGRAGTSREARAGRARVRHAKRRRTSPPPRARGRRRVSRRPLRRGRAAVPRAREVGRRARRRGQRGSSSNSEKEKARARRGEAVVEAAPHRALAPEPSAAPRAQGAVVLCAERRRQGGVDRGVAQEPRRRDATRRRARRRRRARGDQSRALADAGRRRVQGVVA